MKKVLLVLLIVVFNTGVAYADLTVHGPDGSQTYTKKLYCKSRGLLNVYVKNKPDYREDGVDLYISPEGYLVFIDGNIPINCSFIAYGWEYDGIVKAVHKETNTKKKFFKIHSENAERYYEMKTGEIKYRISEKNKKLIVSDVAPEEPGRKIEIERKWSGRSSKIVQPQYYRIENNDEWKEVWKKHSDEDIPEVDFSKNMIMGFFFGQTYNTSGVIINEVRDLGEKVRIRYNKQYFQTMGPGHLTVPFGIFVFPRSEKHIYMQKNIQNYIGGPPKWKDTYQFEPDDFLKEGKKIKVLSDEEYRQRHKEWYERFDQMTNEYVEALDQSDTKTDKKSKSIEKETTAGHKQMVEQIKQTQGEWTSEVECKAHDDCKYVFCNAFDKEIDTGLRLHCDDGQCVCREADLQLTKEIAIKIARDHLIETGTSPDIYKDKNAHFENDTTWLVTLWDEPAKSGGKIFITIDDDTGEVTNVSRPR